MRVCLSFDRALPEIIATFLELAPLLAERSRKAAEQAKIWAERQRQLELERQRREQDDKRWRRFVQIADEWRRVELAREFIRRLRELDLPATDAIDGLDVCECLDWAEAKAHESDPLQKGVDGIFADVARVSAWTRFG